MRTEAPRKMGNICVSALVWCFCDLCVLQSCYQVAHKTGDLCEHIRSVFMGSLRACNLGGGRLGGRGRTLKGWPKRGRSRVVCGCAVKIMKTLHSRVWQKCVMGIGCETIAVGGEVLWEGRNNMWLVVFIREGVSYKMEFSERCKKYTIYVILIQLELWTIMIIY